MITQDTFSYTESDRQKRIGMALAAGNRLDLLTLARSIAMNIAWGKVDRTCNADEVQRILVKNYGLQPSDLGPAAGSLFSGSDWEFTGERVKSANIKNHGRELKVWRLKI